MSKDEHWKDRKFRSKRHWLNPVDHDDTGAISWEVKKEGRHIFASMTFRDCSRQIDLNFDVGHYPHYDPGTTRVTREYNNRMKKLRIIEDAVKGMQEDLTTAYEMLVKEIETAPEEDERKSSTPYTFLL